MSDTEKLVRHTRKIACYEGITAGQSSVLSATADALEAADKAITWGDEEIARLTNQLAAAQAVIAEAHGTLSWMPNHDGEDLARVEQDYMHRAQLADEAFSILPQSPTDALRERDAVKWDEGYEAGRSDEAFDSRGLSTDPDAHEHPHDNPYRKDKTDE